MVKARKILNANQCIVPECDEPREGARGLCKKCYGILYAAIRKGETTWEKLEARGLALPKRKAGRKISSPATRAVRKLKKHK